MVIYTIGYGGRGAQELLDLLAANGVRTVVDVRLRPDRASMGCYALAKSPDKGIQKVFASKGITYVSLVQLGNVFVDCEDWKERYQKLLDLAGDFLIEPLIAQQFEPPLCLMCAEKRAAECHRSLIADLLKAKGHTIVHIE